MPRPVKLSLVRDERREKHAKEFRKDMFNGIRDIVKDAGNDIAGYAVVVWNKDGANWSTLKPGGPVQSRLTPTFVGDALTQHVTCDLVRR